MAAWVKVVAGLVTIGAVVVGLMWKRSRRRIPDAELRDQLSALLTDFKDIVASGGKPPAWFMETDRQQRHLRFASLNGAVVDRKLNEASGAARGWYDECFACSSPSRDSRLVEKQLDAARAGQTAVAKAIERLNLLFRKYGHRR